AATPGGRYAKGAAELEPGLCCPTVDYDPQFLKLLPQEIIEKDYGCGDPSAHAREGDVIVDLGSGAGKVCYILAQKVGASGKVIGLDFNDAMLSLARKYEDEMERKIGYRNFAFHKARIQDMALNLDEAADWLEKQPITSVEQADAYRAYCDMLRREQPLIADNSIDLIVSNCVLNLVRTEEKEKLFREMHRILRPGGRVVVSDIVCDEDPTPRILNDAHLWSGCIAGAFREDRFWEMFEEAGFYGIETLKYQSEPWQTIDGIEFRAMTIRAYKGKEGPCFDHNQAVIYTGPWKQVHDDDGHLLYRGKRMAVCEKTFRLMTDPYGPYAGQVVGVEPIDPVAAEDAPAFNCAHASVRSPRQTKGMDYQETQLADGTPCCEPGSDCC
ncbi:MAG: methyltransferase domain-containing protein, partial [Rhodospirillales bacterium]|nr:methyltransferase domain-containing protein [Rhodospirillales bacterium]